MISSPKIIFMGTPEFGAIILDELAQSPFKPQLVITSKDKPTGRKQKLASPPVKDTAQNHQIPVHQTQDLKDPQTQKVIQSLDPDLIVVAGFGQIIPPDILEIPQFGSLNVHPSLLPKYRGASPIRSTILNGDKTTGATIILMDEKIDHGPILSRKKMKIANSQISYKELKEKLALLGAKLLIDTIPKWIKGEINPQVQDHSKSSYAPKLKKEDGRINWEKSASEIERKIRAFNPWPSSFCKVDGKILKIWKAKVFEYTKESPLVTEGKIFLAPNDKIAVQCKKDFLIIERLQLEGGKKMTSKEFLRGHPDFVGKILR